MSTANIVIEDQRTTRTRDVRRGANAHERVWACVSSHTRLTATELADAMVRPRCKIYRDFSEELARAARWRSNRS